ncbi:unnamed protein product [Chrysodeixis includens]|uniref:Fucosyltransferase n=1 Tax=Chrysodeixis includens TaxID=689277 RepID=A0A9N8L688_CHRIL|nr:unnamed protein product [Chrysodeixis includens]
MSVSLPQSLSNGESTEEQQGYTYNSYYAPSTVNFHDIYSNSLALLAEDPVLTTQKEDEAFHLNNLQTQFVEFHPHTQTIPTITEPPPRFVKASMLKNDTEVNFTTSTTSTTTEEPEDGSIRVIPIRKDIQRGVLDLLFPAARVKSFKFLPPNSYLNARELNASQLATEMHRAIQNPGVYIEYFRWHNHYRYVKRAPVPDVCQLCRILNEQADKRQVINQFRQWWNPDYYSLCTKGVGRFLVKKPDFFGVLEINHKNGKKPETRTQAPQNGIENILY